MSKFIVLLAFLVSTLPAFSAILVQGTIVQEFTPQTWAEPFKVTPESFATVVLEIGCKGEAQNRDCDKGLHQEIKVTGLPIAFVVETDDPKIKCTNVNGQRCFLSALVNGQKGEINKVGDLISETPGKIISPARNFVLKAGGLEPCTAPNSGGLCI